MTTRRASETTTEYDCAICLSTPEFQVHQCRNGHLFCAECLLEHKGHRNGSACPTCRVPLPSEPIRNLVAERAIARRPATCKYCNGKMTYGELVAHHPRCPKRTVQCVASAEGCPWAGKNVAGEQKKHEATCAYAICRRIVEPVRTQLREVVAENARLRQRLEAPLRLMYPSTNFRASSDGLWRVYDRDGTFATAGLPDLRLESGRWYYEVTVRATQGCFNCTSARVFGDRLCQKKHPPYETLRRDDHLGPNNEL